MIFTHWFILEIFFTIVFHICELPSFLKLSDSNSLNSSSGALISRLLIILVGISESHTCLALQFWNVEIKLHNHSYSNWDLFSDICNHPAMKTFKYFCCFKLNNYPCVKQKKVHNIWAFSKITLLIHINWFQTNLICVQPTIFYYTNPFWIQRHLLCNIPPMFQSHRKS